MEVERMNYSKYPRNDILCLDIRSFYASVEALKLGLDPMKEMVAVVGDPSRSGSIVLAASPMLKKTHGISNVSRFFDLPDDPNIYIVQAHMQDYLDVSIEITKLLYKYAPKEAIHTYSVDEMWITTNGLQQLFGNRLEVAETIKREVFNCFGLTCSIGIGDNKFLAKVVMDLHAKQKGIAECSYEDVPALLWPAPIEKIWGIGSRMTHHLNELGIYILKDLAMYDKEKLIHIYGIMGEQLYAHAWGIDLSPVYGDFSQTERKSFSNGITLLRDYTYTDVKICILDLVEEVCWRARSERMAGRTISLSIGYSEDRGGFSRSISIPTHTNSTKDMYEQCLKLLQRFYVKHKMTRRVSVGLTNLCPDHEVQLSLFKDHSKEKDLGIAMDYIRESYGTTAVLRATSYTEAGIILERSKKIGGHYF